MSILTAEIYLVGAGSDEPLHVLRGTWDLYLYRIMGLGFVKALILVALVRTVLELDSCLPNIKWLGLIVKNKAVTKIADLKEGTITNLIGKVSYGLSAAYSNRPDGNRIQILEVVLGDSTGSVRLVLINGNFKQTRYNLLQ